MDQVAVRTKLENLGQYSRTSGSETEALAELEALIELVRESDGFQSIDLTASVVLNSEDGVLVSVEASIQAHGACPTRASLVGMLCARYHPLIGMKRPRLIVGSAESTPMFAAIIVSSTRCLRSSL